MSNVNVTNNSVEDEPCQEPPKEDCDQPIEEVKDDCKCKKYTFIFNFS